MEIEIKREQLKIDMKAREWCKLTYPGHPKGCPNYGQRDTCPPGAPLVQDFVDLRRSLYLIVVEFNLLLHATRMKQLHPLWSDRQARCCLYWQAGVNKELDNECKIFKWSHPGTVTTLCPEAMV